MHIDEHEVSPSLNLFYNEMNPRTRTSLGQNESETNTDNWHFILTKSNQNQKRFLNKYLPVQFACMISDCVEPT